MKSKLMILALLAGGSLFAQPAVYVGARFGYAPAFAIVADDQRHFMPGFLREGPDIIGVDVPSGEACVQIRGFAQHAVAFIRPGNRQANALHLRP